MAVVHTGDCLAVLPTLETNSVDSVVTDPPYELGFMGKHWDRTGVAYNAALWREVYRVLKPGGHLLVFGAARTFHRVACAVEDAGFEIRDQIMWLYGSGFPKSGDLGKTLLEWQGWGTALKPAHEPICVARKPLSESTVGANVKRHRTGALNIAASRVPLREGLGTEGRWPANVVHDGSAEVLTAFDAFGDRGGASGLTGDEPSAASVGRVTGKRKRVAFTAYNDTGTAERFFYCAKASPSDRNDGGLNGHPTVKPTALMEYLVRLVTPPGGVVLDPFAGSGSTGKAAVRLGFRFVGIEIDAAFADLARRRTAVCPAQDAT